MGSCTFGLVFSNLLSFFITCPNQLFRNSFNFYRYNLFLCLLEPVIECRVWNIVANAERVDGNSIGLTLGFVEEPQSFKIFFAKHNLSSFKFSTKVCERDMLVNTPILEAYKSSYKNNPIQILILIHFCNKQKNYYIRIIHFVIRIMNVKFIKN